MFSSQVIQSRRYCLALAVTIALAMSLPVAAATDEAEEKPILPSSVSKILKRNSLGAGNAGVYMAWEDGTPIAMLNLDRPFNPASSIKLVTSMASLDLLGPTHTWRSRLLAATPIVDGSLRGDLFFQGSGDPFMTSERLMYLVAGAHRRGIKHVAGDIIIDDTLFELEQHDPAAFDGKGSSLYNAAPGAAVVNFGASNVIIRAINGSVTVFLEPPSTNFVITNKLKIRKSRCSGNWRSRLRESLRRNETGGATLQLSGTYPSGCGERSFFLLGQSDPAAHAAGAIGGVFELIGGSVSGDWQKGKTPRNAKAVSEIESQTLSEVLRGMNKHSNNFMARNIFLSLGKNGNGKPHTLEKARAEIDKWFTSRKIDTTGMYIENGSGLSRLTRITPRQFGETMLAFNNSLLRHELIASMSILGRDGTAKNWNKRSKSAGAAHIKTGTLSNARATVGVVHNPSGDIIFVVLTETRSTAYARRAIQELLEWSFRLQRKESSG